MSTNSESSAIVRGGSAPLPPPTGDLVPWPLVRPANGHSASGDDLFPWPWVRSENVLTKDGGNYQTPPPGYSEAPGRAKYHATRLGSSVVISAEGTLANLNQIADIRQMPWRIFPPQFGFFVYTPQITLPALRPFAFSETFGFPHDAKTLVIHDADGPHTIEISEPKGASAISFLAKSASAGGGSTATGLGTSLQEAFDHAVAQLPSAPQHPDQLFVYKIEESGLMRGGFAGFHHYYAKVSMSS